jgi:hypothetical protein
MSPTELFNKFYIKFQEYTGVLTWNNAKNQENLFKKVTYHFSHTAANYNYNNIYNIVTALWKIE